MLIKILIESPYNVIKKNRRAIIKKNTMSNYWNKISVLTEVQNLSKIMSEELIRSIEDKKASKLNEEISHQNENSSTDTSLSLELNTIQEASGNNYCGSDAIIAQVLQRQFDEEYDEEVKQIKIKKNGNAKVSVSYENYRHTPYRPLYNLDFDDEGFERVMKDWDRFDTNEKQIVCLSKRGFVMKDDEVGPKHNNVITPCKVKAFPPEMALVDGAGLDLKLSTYEFTKPKIPKNHQVRVNKMLDCRKTHVAVEIGLDGLTRDMLFKLIDSGVFVTINAVIATGKEANILHGSGSTTFPVFRVPQQCAIKVFKTALKDETTLKDFKARHRYIEADYRFKDRYVKKNPRKVVNMWAEKEMYNMKILQNIGVNCPDAVCLMKNILVMSYVGNRHIPAPRLVDIMVRMAQWQIIYQEVVDAMHKMYKLGNLVHADLSEHNILWWENKCWFIDVSQSVRPDHPRGLEYLLRDCRNISNFFVKKNVPHVKSADNMFKAITGFKEVDVKKFEVYKMDASTNLRFDDNLT